MSVKADKTLIEFFVKWHYNENYKVEGSFKCQHQNHKSQNL